MADGPLLQALRTLRSLTPNEGCSVSIDEYARALGTDVETAWDIGAELVARGEARFLLGEDEQRIARALRG